MINIAIIILIIVGFISKNTTIFIFCLCIWPIALIEIIAYVSYFKKKKKTEESLSNKKQIIEQPIKSNENSKNYFDYSKYNMEEITKSLDAIIANRQIHNKEIEYKCEEQKYKAKESIISKTEEYFWKILKSLYEDKYIITPQVNLATIIDKTKDNYYRNDLFRNIDFVIFTKIDYKPKVLIEINDATHNEPKRQYRDIKIKEIIKEAGYPLITFWAHMPNEVYYIKKRIDFYL